MDEKDKNNRGSVTAWDAPQRVGDIVLLSDITFFPKQLGDCIGRGAFGRVYKGLNFRTGEVVAVKQINKDMLTPKQLPGIMQELELLQKLDHPHVTKFIEYHEIGDFLFFVMEYVESGSLNSTMKKYGVFPESLLVLYVAQVLQGLAYLHDMNVVHRDIKGCNLLLTKEGTVKLADFGSCKYAALDTQFTVVGTPFWMAPEIIEMQGGGKCSDIWSLGRTVLELLTGKPPYWDSGSFAALFKMVDHPHPPLPDELSDNLRDFLLECFIRDVKKRPGPRELLKHPWITSSVFPGSTVKTPPLKEASSTICRYNSGELKKPTVMDIAWDPTSTTETFINRQRRSLTDMQESLRESKKENHRLALELQRWKGKAQKLEKQIKKMQDDQDNKEKEWEIERKFFKLKLKKMQTGNHSPSCSPVASPRDVEKREVPAASTSSSTPSLAVSPVPRKKANGRRAPSKVASSPANGGGEEKNRRLKDGLQKLSPRTEKEVRRSWESGRRNSEQNGLVVADNVRKSWGGMKDDPTSRSCDDIHQRSKEKDKQDAELLAKPKKTRKRSSSKNDEKSNQRKSSESLPTVAANSSGDDPSGDLKEKWNNEMVVLGGGRNYEKNIGKFERKGTYEELVQVEKVYNMPYGAKYFGLYGMVESSNNGEQRASEPANGNGSNGSNGNVAEQGRSSSNLREDANSGSSASKTRSEREKERTTQEKNNRGRSIANESLSSTDSSSSGRPSASPCSSTSSASASQSCNEGKAKHCARCKKVVLSHAGGRSAMGMAWHVNCFCCSYCDKVLEEFLEKNGKPYCVPHFEALFGHKRGGCGKVIQGDFIQAMNKYWHEDHFRCSKCSHVIVGGFVEKENGPLCCDCLREESKAPAAASLPS
ncbi:Four and a half LIM domains protein 1-like [Balamuthia mandrillaris]